jgi:ribonuclease P protein component
VANNLHILRRNSEFSAIFEGGKKISHKWLLLAYKKNALGFNRFGWTVSRKVGPAVIRNRIKRWCREFFRSIQNSELSIDVNVVFRAQGNDFYHELTHEEFILQLQKLWDQAGRSI